MDNQFEDQSTSGNILDIGAILLRWIWLPALVAIITAFITYSLSAKQPGIYQSSTLVMVDGGSDQFGGSNSVYQGEQLARTYSLTMSTRPVLNSVSDRLGYAVSPGAVNVAQVESTQLIRVTVTDTDPVRAADIANALVSVFGEQVSTDQAARYAELKAELENEMADLDTKIAAANEKLALIQSNGIAEPLGPQELVNRAQLDSELSQHQQTKSYLLSNYQQIKYSEAQGVSTIIQKDPAIPNATPIYPLPFRSGIQGGIVAFVIVAGLIFVFLILQDEIRDPEEFMRRWNLSVLAVIPAYDNNENPIITMSQPRAPISESFRSLRTNLQFSGIDKTLKKILITSASPSEGKTSITANLATAIALNNQEVIVIDSDLRKPRLHKLFQLTNRVGLADYFIRSGEQLSGSIKETMVPNLSIMTSGSLPPNPSELLNSDKMQEILKDLSKTYDLVILDTPPLLAVTDALVLAPLVDGVILVVNPAKTKRGAIKHAIEQLRHVNAHIIGIVLNNLKSTGARYYSHNYYYRKGYGSSKEYLKEIKIDSDPLGEGSPDALVNNTPGNK